MDRFTGLRKMLQTACIAVAGTIAFQTAPAGAQNLPMITVSVDDAQVNEGATIRYRFEITGLPPSPEIDLTGHRPAPEIVGATVRVTATSSGSNPVPIDTRDLGTTRLWFTEGVERQVLTVRTRRDSSPNAARTITATVASSHKFRISGDSSVTATVSDHAQPAIEIGTETRSLTVVEGQTAQFVIELDDPAQSDVDVNVQVEVTSGAQKSYPALHPTHIGTRTVRINRGSRRGFVPVASYDDDVVNGDKEVSLTLLAGTGYTVGSSNTATGKFLGDIVATTSEELRDGADKVKVRWNGCGQEALVSEADTAVQFKVELDGQVEAAWNFSPSVSTGTKYTAVGAQDYNTAHATGIYTMEALERSKIFSVDMVNDEKIENEERFRLLLSVNGAMSKNIEVAKNCNKKVARIRDDDTANFTVGKQTRRVEEGQEIELQVTLEGDTSTTCAIPFAITIRGRAHGTSDAINTLNSNARGTRSTNIAACAGGPATISFGTRAVQGDQGTRKVVIELWTTDSNSEGRDPRHGRIEIDGARSALAKYTVYIDESDTTTPVNTPAMKVRLQGGATPNQGRLEVFHDSAWGTVCDDYWNNSSAGVACRSLGFPGGTVKPAYEYTRAYYGAGGANVPIHFDDVRCNGSEATLFECRRRTNGNNCRHNEDVGVNCISRINPPATEPLPIVIMDVRSSTLEVNEGDEAVFWIERIEAGTTALEVDVNVTALDGDTAQSPAQSYLGFPEEDVGARTVTIPAGGTRASLAVTLQDDDVLPDQYPQAKAEIISSTRYQLGATQSATATYTDGSYRTTEGGQREFDDTDDHQVMGWKECGEELVVNEEDGVATLTIESRDAKTSAYRYTLVRVNMEESASRHNDYNDADATGTISIEPFTSETSFRCENYQEHPDRTRGVLRHIDLSKRAHGSRPGQQRLQREEDQDPRHRHRRIHDRRTRTHCDRRRRDRIQRRPAKGERQTHRAIHGRGKDGTGRRQCRRTRRKHRRSIQSQNLLWHEAHGDQDPDDADGRRPRHPPRCTSTRRSGH